MARSPRVPSFTEEKAMRALGYQNIAGIDEVGRGALAGPVVAAAVILPPGIKAPWLRRVRDSKLLSPKQREELSPKIRQVAVSVGVGLSDCDFINGQGIVRATEAAMRMAVGQLSPPAQALLIDYFRLPGVNLPQKGVVNGDTLCFSIACASIVAKVARDHLMAEFDGDYPGYEFARHKGYGTEEHLACLRRLGPSPIHRRGFQPVMEVISERT